MTIPLLSRDPEQPISSAPPDSEALAGVLRRHADNPSAYLALNSGTRHFSVPSIDGLIAYAPAGRTCIVQFGGVFADPADQNRLLEAFRSSPVVGRRRMAAVQLLRPDAERYADRNFTVNQFGTSYSCSLQGFSLQGRTFAQLRNKISKARRAGIVVTEVGVDDPGGNADPASTGQLAQRLDDIDRQWLAGKGRHVKQLSFMVGERGGSAASLRRLFVATGADGEVVGYIQFSPSYGRHPGWLYDLPRRRPDAPQGTIQLVMLTAIERFKREGAQWLHLGLTPFTGISSDHELAGRSPTAARLVRALASHGHHIYPAADQVAFKLKWAPDLIQPEYVAFAGGVNLRAVVGLLRLTNAL